LNSPTTDTGWSQAVAGNENVTFVTVAVEARLIMVATLRIPAERARATRQFFICR
jgi:hypothetical protein